MALTLQYYQPGDYDNTILRKILQNQTYAIINGGGGGGGGTPGGANGSLQYNNAGAFGGYVPGGGVVTWIQSPLSANLLAAVSDATGTGVLVFGTSPTLASPTLTGTTTVATANATTLNATNFTFGSSTFTGLLANTSTTAGGVLLGNASLFTTYAASTATPRVQRHGTTNAYNASGSYSYWSNSTSGPALWFTASRGTSVGSYTISQAGDSIGSLLFEAADGTDFARAASISAAVEGTPGANVMPGRLMFSTSAAGSSTPTERLRIDSQGVFTRNGTDLTTAAAMGALVIDVTKENNTKSISIDSTFTFSATPGTSQWFGADIINTDTNSHVLTIPSSISITNSATITSLTINASSRLRLFWYYDGTNYEIYGDPSLMGTQISSSIATGSAVSLTTATPANVTSITLTPGTWSVNGTIVYKPSSATSTRQDGSINGTSATLSTTQGEFFTNFFSTTAASVNFTGLPPERIITVTSNTTYYLVAQATFSAGTMAAFGEIHAIRLK